MDFLGLISEGETCFLFGFTKANEKKQEWNSAEE